LWRRSRQGAIVEAQDLSGEEVGLPGEYAGRELSTGRQAECYANEYRPPREVLANGKTYAELGDIQTALRAQIAAAQSNNDARVVDLQKELADLTREA